MIINSSTLGIAFTAFKTIFNAAFGDAKSHLDMVAMRVPSSTAEETYGWLGQWPQLRKWVGDRVIKNLKTHGFTIRNEKFESTVEVARDDISDDRIGLYKPMFSEMGRTARVHPDSIVFELLKAGFESNCYDGQFFFDTDHPVQQGEEEIVVSNMQGGEGDAWFLIDSSRQIRPFIWQEREDYELQTLNTENSDHVFMRDQYLYGVRARCNAGYGLWQLAFGSKAILNAENYAAARRSMMELRGDEGTLLGVTPTVLIVPPSLETAALTLLKADEIDGTSNIWRESAELIVTPHLA